MRGVRLVIPKVRHSEYTNFVYLKVRSCENYIGFDIPKVRKSENEIRFVSPKMKNGSLIQKLNKVR